MSVGFLSSFLLLRGVEADSAAHPRRSGVVHRVIDGDTFVLETGEKIRLIGVDAPEYEPWKGRIDPFGREASLFLRKLLDKQTVLLEEDLEAKDKYGRSLAYVYLKDGEFVNLRLVREGLARAKRYLPNERYYAVLKEAQSEARAQKKELWSEKSSSKLLAKKSLSN